MVEGALDHFKAHALSESHPAIGTLRTLFGEHTFFIEDNGFEHRPASNTGGTCAALSHGSLPLTNHAGFSGAGDVHRIADRGHCWRLSRGLGADRYTLMLVLAAILAVSAVKLWSKSGTQSTYRCIGRQGP